MAVTCYMRGKLLENVHASSDKEEHTRLPLILSPVRHSAVVRF